MKRLLFILALLITMPLTSNAGNIVMYDSDGQKVGTVANAYRDFAWVLVDFNHETALLQIRPWEIAVSWPEFGPMLFFENPDCDGSGGIYTRPELIDMGWARPRVVVTPGPATPPDPSGERFAYIAAEAEMAMHFTQSLITPEGFCENIDPEDRMLWRVEKIRACEGEGGYNLHWCYPPPYDLIKK